MLKALPRLALAVVLVTACGKHADNAKKDAGLTPTVAPIALPTLGVDRIARFNFIYDEGAAAYARAAAAAKKKDWPAVRTQAEAALAKDPMHLDAHRLLGVALAQAGEHAAAVDHLVTAIAADYYAYGPRLAEDPDLAELLKTQHGQALVQLAQQIHDEYGRRIKTALWVIGRRRSFSWPDKPGVQASSSRGELYAYDRDAKRYYRLTHTDHQVAGFTRSPSGNEVVLLGFDRVDHPKAPDDAPPLLARPWAWAFDATEWKPTTPKITLPAARVASVYYGEGDQLLAATAPATGRWTIGDWTVQSIDRSTGKLTKTGGAPGLPRIELTLDEGRLLRPAAIDGITAAWAGDPATAPQLQLGGATIRVPESGQAAHETVAVAPGAGSVAFATAVDPCAKDAAPSLYVASGKAGALKHLLTAKSRFPVVWLDATTLAYEDGDGSVRLWDAASGREAQRVDNKPGLALAVLSLAGAPLCKQAPPVAEPAGSGEELLPPEEGSGSATSGGPVTSPQ